MRWFRSLALPLLVGVAALSQAASASAQTYPNRPVRMIIAYAAGGTSDIIGRTLANTLEKSMGASFVVDNRPGGNGIIAAEAAMRAAPDGYTLWLADTGHFAINPTVVAKLPYDPLTDFAPITQLTRQDFFVIVRKDFPADTLQDFVALSKSRAGGLSYGTVGPASVHNLGIQRIKLRTGANLVHIPYKGNAELKPALLAGQIDMTVSTITGFSAELEAGTLKALAFAGAKRDPQAPNVPTFAEIGLSGIDIDISTGLFAPAGTPREIVQRLRMEVAKAIQDPEFQRKNQNFRFELVGSTPEEFTKKIGDDIRQYRQIVKEANIQLN